MTFNHDDIRERLVDFLYGELDAEARSAFDAHLNGCGACRGEVASAERARVIGRAVARAPLGDAVPPGVRARALAAAHAAAARAEPARESPSAPKVASGADAARGPSWFQRLRGRWAFPTFATVAALAAFLLVRGTIFREAKQPLGERSLDELAPKEVAAPSPPPATAVEAQAPSPRRPPVSGLFDRDPGPESAAPFRGKDEASRAGGGLGSLGNGVGRGPAAAAERRAAKRAANRREEKRDDRALPLAADEPSPARRGADDFGAAAAPSPQLDRLARDREKAESPSAPGGAAQRRSAVESADKAAAAPPPYGGGAPAPRPAAQPEAEAVSGAASAVVAPAAPAPPPAKPMAASRAAGPPPSPDATRSSPAKKSRARASEAPMSAPSGAPADPAAEAITALAGRGDAAMAAHRWTEAAAIYHQLLQSYPADASAPAWRKKLAAAQAAIAADTGQFAAPPP
jgi:hypothetical protein